MRRLLALATIAAAMSCAPTTRATEPRILVIGDSNVAFAKPYFPANVTTNATGLLKATNRDWPRRIAAHRGTYDVAVVQLGTNDACREDDGKRFKRGLLRVLRSFDHVPVVWNLVRPDGCFHPQYVTRANKVIAWAHRRLGIHVGYTIGHFAGHPEWISPDRVHFSEPEGRAEFARWCVENATEALERSEPGRPGS